MRGARPTTGDLVDYTLRERIGRLRCDPVQSARRSEVGSSRSEIRPAVIRILVALLIVTAGTDHARAIGPEFQVNSTTTSRQQFPVVSSDGAGGFVVVWTSNASSGTDTDGSMIQAQRFTSSGAPVGGEFQVNTYTTGLQQKGWVSPDGAGGFVVVWYSDGSFGTDTDNTSIQGQRFSSGGVPMGGEFQINTYTTNFQAFPRVSPDGAGGFVVVWTSDGSYGTDTNLDGVLGQRFDGSGAPVGGEFQVNTYTTHDQGNVLVGPDGAGGFVVVWTSIGSSGTDTDGSSVQGQRFSSTGTPVGGEFQVNSYTVDSQLLAGLGSDGAGGFVVVWTSDGSSGTDADAPSVQGQRFSSTGVPIGAEFQANFYTTGEQRAGVVSADGGGGFVVVWSSDGSIDGDTDGRSIQAQRFASTGAPVGRQFQVNTTTTADQQFPTVGSDGSGGFVVLWTSDVGSGTDTGESIQAQRFSNDPIPIGVVAKKLVVVDKLTLAGKAKTVYLAKDIGVEKGLGFYPDGIGVTFRVLYDGELGALTIPMGELTGTEGWKSNTMKVAKFLNKDAPAGSTVARTAIVKPGKVVKLVAKGLGDGEPLDISSQGPPSGSVFSAYCVDNGGEERCHCSEFADCSYKVIAAGTGAKLVCKSNVADSSCTALGSPGGAFLD